MNVIAFWTAVGWPNAGVLLAGEEPLAKLEGHAEAVQCVAFSPDGKTLASGSADKMVKLWDVSTGKERASLKGHADRINCVAYSPDGKTLASGGVDKTIKLWDPTTGKELATLDGHALSVAALMFSPNVKLLASGGGTPEGKGESKLWHLESTKERASFAAFSEMRALAFSPDGATLATGCTAKVQLWDVAATKELASPWNSFFGSLNSVAFSPDGKTLATGGGYKNRPSQTVLWDVDTGKRRATLNRLWGVSSVAFSPDGKTVAAWSQSLGGTGEIRLYDPATAEELRTLHADGVSALAFSPDGWRLATSDNGPTIKLWKVRD